MLSYPLLIAFGDRGPAKAWEVLQAAERGGAGGAAGGAAAAAAGGSSGSGSSGSRRGVVLLKQHKQEAYRQFREALEVSGSYDLFVAFCSLGGGWGVGGGVRWIMGWILPPLGGTLHTHRCTDHRLS